MIGGGSIVADHAVHQQPLGITTQLVRDAESSSSFFINYLALRSFGLVPFRLSST
jgi:hypothetical protein